MSSKRRRIRSRKRKARKWASPGAPKIPEMSEIALAMPASSPSAILRAGDESLVDSVAPVVAPLGSFELKEEPLIEKSVSLPDFDARFFESSTSETWLAHELELRDPRLVRKMTATVARRRAHLARYVVGVVSVAAALGVAALVKFVAFPGDGSVDARAGAGQPASNPPAGAVRGRPKYFLGPAEADPSTPAAAADSGGN